MAFVAYPKQPIYKTKKSLRDAIVLAEKDVEFVVGVGVFGLKTRKLSQFEPGEILHFQGPTLQNPTYYGRLVCTAPVKSAAIWMFEVE